MQQTRCSTMWIFGRCQVIAALAVAVLSPAFAADAKAACFTTTTGVRHQARAPMLPIDARNGGSSFSDTGQDRQASIVGLWNVTFLFGDGPAVFDQGFQLWHGDGTELNVSNGVPPLLGNVCVGVWKSVGPRTVKLRHVTWNWDADGHLTGTFLVVMTVRVDRRGNAFSGTYVSDSFDLSGAVIEELHAEGVVRGTRITVD